MKKFSAIAVVLFAAALYVALPMYANSVISVYVDGECVEFIDQEPVIINGRTLVPIRGVFEQMGFAVEWLSETRQVKLLRHDAVIIITINSRTFYANGDTHDLDVPAQIIGGRTMLPLRAVLESVGYSLEWDSQAQSITIIWNAEEEEIIPEQTPEPEPMATSEPSPTPTPRPTSEPRPTPTPSPSPTPINVSQFERRVFELVNEQRRLHGLSALTWDSNLAAAARAHSQDMADHDELSHLGSDGSYPGLRAHMAGADNLRNINQNIIGGRRTPEAVVERMMDSEEYRFNVLSDIYTHTGVGFAQRQHTHHVYYVTQKFGTSISSTPTPSLTSTPSPATTPTPTPGQTPEPTPEPTPAPTPEPSPPDSPETDS
ncbi:MAG: CAP domain-containing protein [Clostridiales bacterium]|jgi:uncharacterized protein YkwD|nr:CAP domain-containing protein [Clostridiales bacterium]